jgi:hypothetical protein
MIDQVEATKLGSGSVGDLLIFATRRRFLIKLFGEGAATNTGNIQIWSVAM